MEFIQTVIGLALNILVLYGFGYVHQDLAHNLAKYRVKLG